MPRHRRLSIALTVLAAVGLVATLLLVYARMAVTDADQFTTRAQVALRDEAVRSLVSEQVTEQVLDHTDRDLVGFQPVIAAGVSAAIGSPPFQSVFRRAVFDLHRSVFARDHDTVTLTLTDIGGLVASSVGRIDPAVARKIPPGLDESLLKVSDKLNAIDATRTADHIREAGLIAAILTALLAAAALLTAPDRRQAVARLGAGAMAAGGLLYVAYGITHAVVPRRFDQADQRDAARAIVHAFFADLRTWAVVTAIIGAVVVAAARSLVQADELERWVLATGNWLLRPGTRVRDRALRALAFTVLGALLLLDREVALQIIFTLLGLGLLLAGAEELLRTITVANAAAAFDELQDTAGDVAGDVGQTLSGWRRRLARVPTGDVARVSAAAVTVTVVAIVLLVATGGTSGGHVASAATRTCNGSAALCDKRVDEVVFPATHNSMSSGRYPRWLFGEQEATIGGQLRDGIRGLLIDAYFGYAKGGRVATDLDGLELKQSVERELGPDGYQAALRIRGRLGFTTSGDRRIFLCHGACELGAIDAVGALREITDYLARDRGAVIVIVIQDEGPLATDMAKVFQASGLRKYVYTGRFGPPWPTFGELVRTNQRVLVMAEKHAQGVPWYHHAYEWTQETPYHFTKPSQFSCAPNRGPSTASLFLINNWIDTSPVPKPSNAAKVNAYAPLLARARQCQRERNALPNLIAVDFAHEGDVEGVADTLNGVPRPTG